jgi:hypothetical protein
MRSTRAQEKIFKNKSEKLFITLSSFSTLPFPSATIIPQMGFISAGPSMPTQTPTKKNFKKISFLKIIFKKKREEIHLLFFLKI